MKKEIQKNKTFILLAFLAGVCGGAFCMAINGYKSLGTAADWLSGIGSLCAIIFAYKQIDQQKKEYDEQRKQYDADKEEKTRQEILANRPFFSIVEQTQLKNRQDHLWLTDKDMQSIDTDKVFEKPTLDYTYFKVHIFAYKLKNVSQAVANNVALKVEYQTKGTSEVTQTDYCNLRTCVGANEQAIILPHSIMSKPDTYSNYPKKIYLYFTSMDGREYCQRWTEKVVIKDSLCAEQVNIKETPIEEMTSHEGCSRVYIPFESLTNKDTKMPNKKT